MIRDVQTKEMIKSLRKMGFSRYRIAEQIHVSWRTVVMWETGVIKDLMPERYKALKSMYNNPPMDFINEGLKHEASKMVWSGNRIEKDKKHDD